MTPPSLYFKLAREFIKSLVSMPYIKLSFLASSLTSAFSLKTLLLLSYPFFLSVFLSACAQFSADSGSPQQAKAYIAGKKPETAIEEKKAEGSEYKEFSPDTLYALVLAEIALDRDMPDIGLSYYRREAHKTHDPGVIKRALEISTWMEAHQISLELIALWQEVEPQNPIAHKIMAQQQLYFGLVEGALASVEKVLALDDDFNFDYFNQVLPSVPEEDRIVILRRLEDISEKYPKNSQVWLARAHMYGLLDQRQSALEAAAKAKRYNRKDDRPVVMHSELKFNYNDHNSALNDMQRGLKKFPNSQALHLLYARSLLKVGKLGKAEQHIKDSIERFDRDHEYRFQMSLLCADYKLNLLAKQLLRESLVNNYRREESNLHLSRLAEQEGNFEEAIGYLSTIKPGHGFVEAQLQIAFLLNEQGKFEEAIASLEEAHSLQADNGGSFLHAQADILSESGKEEKALEVFTKAISLFPNSIKLRYGRSMLAEQMNRIDITEQDLLAVIEKEPRNALALNALGYTLTNKTNRHDEALVYIEKALEISPNDPAIIDSMGWVQFQLGNYDEAVSFLRKAIALEADHEIAAHLGEALWVSGMKTEAKEVWDDALAKNKDSEILKSVMQRYLK
jgi:tetratricopeptide (TPR) repeat protein